MRRSVVSNAGNVVVDLGDSVPVLTYCGKFNVAKHRIRSIFCNSQAGHGRHGSAVRDSGQHECKRISLAPVVELLGSFEMGFHGSKRVGDHQRIIAVVFHISGKRVGIGIGGHGDNHFMRSGVVRHAGNVAIDLGNRVFVNADGRVFEFCEYSGASVFGNHQPGSGRHGSAVGNGGKHEGEGVCLAPVVELLGCLEVRLCGSEGVGDDKRIRTFIIHLCHEIIRVGGFGHGHGDNVRRSVVSDSGHVVVDLGDGVLIHANVGIFNVGKHRGRSVPGNHKPGHGRHWRAVVDGGKQEGERIGFAPVIEILGRLEMRLYRSEGVSDHQRIRSVVFNSGGKRVCVRIRGHGHGHGVRRCVIGYAGNAVIDFGDSVLVLTYRGEFNVVEHRLRSVLCNSQAGHCRHGSAVGNGSQHEGERFRFAPVVELLGSFEMSFRRSKRVGDHQRIRAVVLNCSGKRVGIGIGCHGDGHHVRRRIVSNARNVFVDLCDSVFIYSYIRIFKFCEYGCGSVLGSFQPCSCRHWCAVGNGSKHEGKGVGLAPVAELLGGLEMRLYRSESISDYQQIRPVVFDLGGKRVGIGIGGHGDGHDVRRCVVRNAGNVAVDLGDSVPVHADVGIFNFVKHGGRSDSGSNHACHRGHGRSVVDGGQHEGERIGFPPVFERLGGLEMRFHRDKRVGDHQRFGAVVLDRSGQFVGVGIGGHGDGHVVRRRVVRYTGNVVVNFGDGVFVHTWGSVFDLVEYCGRRALGSGLAPHCRHGSAFGNGSQHEGERIGFAPVVEILGRLEMRLRRSKRVGDHQRIFPVVFHLGGKRVGIGIGCHGDGHHVRRSVVRNAGDVAVNLGYGVFVHADCGIFEL